MTNTELKTAVYRRLNAENAFGTTDKMIDLVIDLVERAIDRIEEGEDKDEAINEAIDDGMIYTDDQWTAYRFYCDMGDDVNNMWEGLYNTIYAILRKMEA